VRIYEYISLLEHLQQPKQHKKPQRQQGRR
jgi:hypothetical protein